ncbi:peptidase S16 lon domain protein [Desulfovibrio sp. X2]|uniref:Lon protease family protein n=1 Tax=Desulfovibrio sp. X2 TaxID=941449 RepID=UPI000358EDAD|nr:ATP-binding protein [Desulfovibrio sp. X2]EPR40847.1 peptidase S16 lon domain protein [Desulfovibrio sp. X2]
MAAPKSLPVSKLSARLEPDKVPFADSTAIPHSGKAQGQQPRALQAFELGLAIPGGEHHIFLSGEPELGRTYFVRRLLAPRAARLPAPPDQLYLNNFEDPDRPLAVSLPAGTGRRFKAAMAKAVSGLQGDIPARLEQDAFHKQREALVAGFASRRDAIYREMEQMAEQQGFALAFDDNGGMTLVPLWEGKLVNQPEFDRLSPQVQKSLRAARDQLLSELMKMLRRIQAEEKNLREDEANLEKALVQSSLDEHLGPLSRTFGVHAPLASWLDAARAHILDNLDQIMPAEEEERDTRSERERLSTPDFWDCMQVNLFVDNSAFAAKGGAPVVVEDHPTFFNLLGLIEREAELGALSTDFTLIKAGSLHRANHGYLVVQAEDLLVHPSAWEGILRALRTAQARVEDPSEHDQPRTRTVEPEPVPLSVKVILIGTDELYETLLLGDPRFRKLFKIKAHLQDTVARTAANIRGFLREVGEIVREAGLLPFTREALGGLVDFSSRLASHQKKLSLQYPLVRDLMVEAAAMASMSGEEAVSGETIRRAQAARDFRANLYEEEFLEDYDKGVIKAPTTGCAVGRVNGLAVSYYGDYAFGLPHQIACTVGVGEGGIIDLEREAELGGPIHTKAMMILKSYLLDRFAHERPLVMAGSLYFEQSYAHVEGDSASGAELAALLSALAEVPLDLSKAFTGAVNQSGHIMAVGDVTRKIEGFFEVCRRRGLTGTQGVIIPADNVDTLMLKSEVTDAVAAGQFAIWPVESIEQALELLTSIPAGKRGKRGYPHGTMLRRVDQRLQDLADKAQSYKRRGRSR